MPEEEIESNGSRNVKFNHKGKPLCETLMSSQLALDTAFHYNKKYYKVSEVISQDECNVNEVDDQTGRVIA